VRTRLQLVLQRQGLAASDLQLLVAVAPCCLASSNSSNSFSQQRGVLQALQQAAAAAVDGCYSARL
jgi:hypothetical protein